MSEVVSRHAAIWLTLDAGGTLGRPPQSLVRSGSVIALAGLASLAMFSLAVPVAIPMVREPQMRVLLHEGKQVLLRADRQSTMAIRGLPGGPQQARRLSISPLADGLAVVVDGARRRLSSHTVLTVENDDPRGIWLGQRRYRGALQISGRGGRLRVINSLGVETYLASVVGSEMPHEWPLAALQAQAVAARTYALRQRSRGGGWDLKATVASQVYRGVESETPSTREAVTTTRSLVLVHRGKLIDAVFHSSSGGVTESSGMVWRYQQPYLVSVPDYDQHSPVHRWQERFDARSLKQRLPEIGGLVDVDVLNRSTSGRVRQARLRGPSGSLVLNGKELRRRLGLKSTLVNFEMVSGTSMPTWTPQPVLASITNAAVSSGSRINRITASVATGASRSMPKLLAPPPPVLLNDSIQTRSAMPSSGLQLLVRGQGFGHGVGMSQWGAHGMAEQGADFRAILGHYYSGAAVVPFRAHHHPAMARIPAVEPVWRG